MIDTKIIDGRIVSESVLQRLQEETIELIKKYGSPPSIAVVIIGNDPASHVYVKAKEKAAQKIGFNSKKIALPKDSTQAEVLEVINQLNNDKDIHGILVQSPPPKHINEEEIILSINPEKDVDCFHPYNVGKVLIGKLDGFIPCTPNGCIELLRYYKINPQGKNVVIIGRSNIVGKPIAALLMQKDEFANATVTVCHSKTRDISSFTKKADIIISALGKPRFLTREMVQENSIVIDVGINRIEDKNKKSGFRLVGDADYKNLLGKCQWITPVPGGVGPMTIAMLMQNTLLSYKNLLND